MDVAGARYPESLDGDRILPPEGRTLTAFHSEKVEPGDAFYWEHEGEPRGGRRAVQLVSRFPDRWELYDLEADRCEMRDLSRSDASRAARMVGRYDR